MKLSVIMAVYNGGKYLPAAIESILNQTWGDFEFIITNDCSTDESLEIIHKYARADRRIIVVNNSRNLKIAPSLNNMVQMARGTLIARMDADDIAVPARFEKQLKIFDEQPGTDLVFGRSIFIDYEGKEICHDWMPPLEQILSYLPRINLVPHPSVMMRKDVFTRFGLYRADVGALEDAEFWNRLQYKQARFYFMDEPVIYYRINPDSVQNFMKNKNMQHYYYHLVNICIQNNEKREALKYLDKVGSLDKLKSLLKLVVPFSVLLRLRLQHGDYNLEAAGVKYHD